MNPASKEELKTCFVAVNVVLASLVFWAVIIMGIAYLGSHYWP